MRLQKETKKEKINNNEIYNLPPYIIKPNPLLSRTEFPDTSLISLADSIKRYGVLQPLVVHHNRDGQYELIAGERRLRACVLLKCHTVPCVIINDTESLEYLSIVENMQKESLNMFDISKSLSRIINNCGKNIKDGAKLLSIGEEELSKKLKLQSFTRAEMQAILNLGVSEEKANILVEFPKEIRYNAIKFAAENELPCKILSKMLSKVKNEKNEINPDDSTEYLKRTICEICRSQEHEEDVKIKEKEKAQNGKTVIVLKDLQVFENAIKKNCEILRKSGLEVEFVSEYSENDLHADYIISVNKVPAES